MIKIIALDKNSSASHTKSYNPQTKKEFNANLKEFEGEVEQIFFKFYVEFETMDATSKQEKWCEEEESKLL